MNRRIRIFAFAVVCVFVGLLAGCQTSQPTVVTQVVERKIEIPKSLLTCSPEPVAGTTWVRQSDVALYINRLAEAGADCRVKLAAVRKLVDTTP